MSDRRYKILVIDDQIGELGLDRENFIDLTGRSGDDFVLCSGRDANGRNSVETVLELVKELWSAPRDSIACLVLLDIRFEDEHNKNAADARFGFVLLKALRERFGRTLPIVMLTSVEEAKREANATQADDFLPKVQLSRERLDGLLLRHGVFPEARADLFGESRTFLLTLRDVRRAVLGGMKEILLLGETGIGKTSLARYVHDVSRRRSDRFIHWYARGGTPEMHRDQLFGHWKAAYTDASSHSPGDAERAHEGTLFIDEIGELAPAAQTELLEYRQRDAKGFRRVRRMGNAPAGLRAGEGSIVGIYSLEESKILVDTILVSATTRAIDHEAWRSEHGFRLDLFNALGHCIRLPPLRERADDIVPMFRQFACAVAGRTLDVSPAVADALRAWSWRVGNVRELNMVAQRAVSLLGTAFDEIHLHHLEGSLKSERPRATPAPAAVVREVPTRGSFIDIEVRGLWDLAERLRRAVLETRRPNGLGSLADIFIHATGAQYKVTDVKREVKEFLDPWFAPSDRKLARWNANEEYQRLREQVKADPILCALYSYACSENSWDDAKARILAADPR